MIFHLLGRDANESRRGIKEHTSICYLDEAFVLPHWIGIESQAIYGFPDQAIGKWTLKLEL